jgi:ferredoxin
VTNWTKAGFSAGKILPDGLVRETELLLLSHQHHEGGVVKVSIDAERCQGHGRCFSLAPALFDSDEIGNGVVIGDGSVSADLVDLARLAQSNCPEHAISIEE